MEKKISKKTLSKSFHHWYYGHLTCFSQEHMQTFGYLTSMLPIIEELYDNKEDQAKALKTYTAFFNTEPQLGTVIVGVTAGLEEARANGAEDVDDETINGLRAGLMGPIAGIGDSLFWGTLRPLAGGIACSLALAGNFFAPILFLLLFNIPNILVRYFGVHIGYNSGLKALTKFEKMGITEKVFQGASIIGLLVIGGMIASMVSVNLGLTIGSGDSAIAINDVLDGIMPKMLPLLTTLGIYKLIKKGVKVNWILLGIIILSILGTFIGIF